MADDNERLMAAAEEKVERAEGEVEKVREEEELLFSLQDMVEGHIDNTVESDQTHFKKTVKVHLE